MLWSMNPTEPMVPASTVKLFTTGFARSVLGGSARRATRVVGQGQLDLDSGEWKGTWALELNGDPSLERAQGSGPTLYDLALQLASGGIRKLSGPLQVQSADGPANAVYPAAWSSTHRGRLFAPPVGPLTLHENIVWLTVRPGEKVGYRARLVETAPSAISSLVTVTAKTRSGRRSRLVLSPSVGRRLGRGRHDRRPRGAAPTHRRGIRPQGGAERRVGLGSGPGGNLVEPGLPQGPRRRKAAPGFWPKSRRRRSTRWRARSTGAASTSAPSCCCSGPAAGPVRRSGSPTTCGKVTGSSDGVYLVDGSGLSYDDRVMPAAFISYLAKFPGTAAGQNFPQLPPGQRDRHPAPPQYRIPRRRCRAGQDRHAEPGFRQWSDIWDCRRERCSSR